jgi:hypothetical protein
VKRICIHCKRGRHDKCDGKTISVGWTIDACRCPRNEKAPVPAGDLLGRARRWVSGDDFVEFSEAEWAWLVTNGRGLVS